MKWIHKLVGHHIRTESLIWHRGEVRYSQTVQYVCSCGRRWKP